MISNIKQGNSMGKKLLMEFDSQVYSIDALKRTCCEFNDNMLINIITNRKRYIVAIENVSENNIADVEKSFKCSLLDNQIRIDTEKQFKTTRELILAQAFAPCENLDEIVNNLDI